ncbi:hypothetical protein [Niabella hibiscisoli]|uniref:hypothetical protein n=1 Tax=Niabella hibiscisoli TaxID=1825928 RepID=UPI001F0E109C|nr:hypothetical protein [Niabella hibiscisoli]MCH5717096.1 hypothetical protein [Niabella hibiscisoli]
MVAKITLLSQESGMKVGFHGMGATLAAIQSVAQRDNSNLQTSYNEFNNWDDFLIFTRELNTNDLFVIISSRKGYNSYLPQFNKLPYYLTNYFNKLSYIILYPEQLETGINMSDIQQADGKLIETLSEQIGAINKAGKYLRNLWKK